MTEDPRPRAATRPSLSPTSSVRRSPEPPQAPTLTSMDEIRPVLRPIPGWVIVVGIPVMLLVAVGAVWLMLGIGIDSTKLEVIRTGGTLGVGLGGVLVLWLGIRRQRSTELDLLAKYEAHELAERTAANTLTHQQQTAEDARTDATARRITELYTKAVEQLGSDKAPVRLGGLYALERLAQDNETQRQTIVNVLCAYLRMPYDLPIESDREDGAGAGQCEIYRARAQEREVRLTAQRIVTGHLKPDSSTYWGGLDLDLTGAQLIDFTLSSAHIGTSTFRQAKFTGVTRFDETTFTRDAEFSMATFTDDAEFPRATFTGGAQFEGAKFAGAAWFEAATFTNDAEFSMATFAGDAEFNEAVFTSTAGFAYTVFAGDPKFSNAVFAGDVVFSGAMSDGEEFRLAAVRPSPT